MIQNRIGKCFVNHTISYRLLTEHRHTLTKRKNIYTSSYENGLLGKLKDLRIMINNDPIFASELEQQMLHVTDGLQYLEEYDSVYSSFQHWQDYMRDVSGDDNL